MLFSIFSINGFCEQHKIEIKINNSISNCFDASEVIDGPINDKITYSEVFPINNKTSFLFSKTFKDDPSFFQQDIDVFVISDPSNEFINISLKGSVNYKKAKYDKQIFIKETNAKLKNGQSLVVTKCFSRESGVKIYTTNH